MGLGAKCRHYVAKIWELLWDEPRESNTEGGLFPAIFGTVMLVFLMAITCFPLGVLAGVYLGEYAKDGPLVRIVRIAVNNLAGIPSIVYGIFGLGFFVYGVGGTARSAGSIPHLVDANKIDLRHRRVALGEPDAGAADRARRDRVDGGGAADDSRAASAQSSLALGATKFQTLMRVLLPMASPGIMTGFILAMARAAGEVAPLMITGVVKLAPTLPLDGQFPFFHPDRKFMHLGFHIFDIGFQSPNVEASKPMVFVTTLLLVLIVLVDEQRGDLPAQQHAQTFPVARASRNSRVIEPIDLQAAARTSSARENVARDCRRARQRQPDARCRSTRTVAAVAHHRRPASDADPIVRVQGPAAVLRRKRGAARDLDGLPAQPGHGPDRPVRLRQVDVPPLPEPDERPDRRRAHHGRASCWTARTSPTRPWT